LIAQIRYQVNNDALIYDDQLTERIEIREEVTIPPQIRQVVLNTNINESSQYTLLILQSKREAFLTVYLTIMSFFA